MNKRIVSRFISLILISILVVTSSVSYVFADETGEDVVAQEPVIEQQEDIQEDVQSDNDQITAQDTDVVNQISGVDSVEYEESIVTSDVNLNDTDDTSFD